MRLLRQTGINPRAALPSPQRAALPARLQQRKRGRSGQAPLGPMSGGRLWRISSRFLKVAAGGVEKLIPGEQEHEPYANAVGQFFADRYGSMEAFKKTLAEDPVGFAADLA